MKLQRTNDLEILDQGANKEIWADRHSLSVYLHAEVSHHTQVKDKRKQRLHHVM